MLKTCHFPAVLLHFTIIFVLEVIYVYWICMVALVTNGVLISFQLSDVNW